MFWDTCQFVKASNLSKLQQGSAQMLEKGSLHHLHVDALEHATCMPQLSHWTFSMLCNATVRASLKGSNPLVQKRSQGIVQVWCNPAANPSEVLSKMLGDQNGSPQCLCFPSHHHHPL